MKSVFFKPNYDEELVKTLTSIIGVTLAKLKNCELGQIKDFQPLAELLHHLDCEKFYKETLAKETQEDKSFELKYGKSKEKTITLSAADHQLLVLMALTQNTMLRPSNMERKDLPDPDYFKAKREIFVKLFNKLGLHQEHKLQTQDIEIAIIGSAFAFRFISRLLYVIPLIKQQKIFCVYINAGKRLLDDLITMDGRDIGATIKVFPDCKEAIAKFVKEGKLKTELDLSKFIVEQLKKENSKAFTGIEIIYSEALPKPGDMRARTDDSVEEIEKKLNKGIPVNKIVVISNNPYTGYQYETYLAKMGEDDLQVAGSQATDDCPILDYYDAFTRNFFATTLRMLRTNYKLEYAEAALIASEYINNSSYKCTTSLINKAYANQTAQPAAVLTTTVSSLV